MTDWYKINKGFMRVREPKIPDEYQEVEYIENSWTQYIKTNLDINTGYRQVMKVRFLNTLAASSYPWLAWGYLWYSWGTYYRLYLNWLVSNNTFQVWFIGTHYDNQWSAVIWTDYEIDFSRLSWNMYFKINWTTIQTSSETRSTSLAWNVCFLWSYAQDWSPQYKANPWMRLYYSKLYNSAWELAGNFVPCFRKSDWEPWMYDLVTDTFFTNAWTWKFLMWRDIAYLPEEYEQVEYVLNTTWEEYINTWITSGNSFVASLSIMPTLLDSEKWFIGGAWTSEDNLLTYYNWRFRWHNGWNWADTISASVNSQYYIWIDATWITLNGSTYNVAAWSRYSWNEIRFFRSNWQSNLSYSPRVKYYGLRMWSQWSFARDYVPCYRKSDWVIWFYDLVNNQFCTNNWGWAFTKGNDVAPISAFNERQFYPGAGWGWALFEIETDFRNYSNISDVYALWWWAWAKWSMQPAVNSTYWFYCWNYTNYRWWQWLYYDISSYMTNAKKIYAHLTWYMPWWYTYQANERIVLCNISRIDGNWETTASEIFATELKWWNYNNNTNIGKAVGWASYTKLVDYWSSNYTWDVDITFEINLESWLVTSVITQPASISMQYTLSASEISWIKSSLKFIDFAFTTYATWINNYIKTAHIKIE